MAAHEALPSFCEFDRRMWNTGRVRINILMAPKSEYDYDLFLVELSKLYDDEKPFTMLIDTRNLKENLPVSFIQKMAKWIKTHKEQSIKYLQKTSIVVNGMFIEYFLKAVFVIMPPSTPCKTTCDIEEGCKNLGWI